MSFLVDAIKFRNQRLDKSTFIFENLKLDDIKRRQVQSFALWCSWQI